ncbi:hypothetical protein [Pasteurella bettyae]
MTDKLINAAVAAIAAKAHTDNKQASKQASKQNKFTGACYV